MGLIAIAIGPILQKYTPKYTENVQKNVPKTIAAARASRLGPRPQSGAAMVFGIFFYAFSVYFGVYFWTIGPIAIAIRPNSSKNAKSQLFYQGGCSFLESDREDVGVIARLHLPSK